MATIVSVANLRDSGIRLTTDEAVAIAQQVIQQALTPVPRETVAVDSAWPSVQNVYLSHDGLVHCPGYESTPAVSEVAQLLQSLLPQDVAVPGGLRYAIARALLEVDVAPYDSLQEFSEALARYERADRRTLIRGVVDRSENAARASASSFPAAIDRRRSALTSDLRRHLREADARLYEHQIALAASRAPARGHRIRVMPALAACAAAVSTLIAAGELMHRQTFPAVPVAPMPPVAVPLSVVPASNVQRVSEPPEPPPNEIKSRTPAVRRVSRPAHTVTPKRIRQKTGHGVLQKLKLQWLKNAFTTHSDPL